MNTHLAIKNMVCARCIRVVSEELRRIGYVPLEVRLGEAVLKQEIQPPQLKEIRQVLADNGFELLDNKKQQLIEQVKIRIIDVLQHADEQTLSTIVFSQYLSKILDVDYTYISTLFSSLEGITLEKYVILQKIERAKELMMYDELSTSQIANKLGYSSVHHLSNQFKKVCGMTPTEFKKLQKKPRLSLDKISAQNAKV